MKNILLYLLISVGVTSYAQIIGPRELKEITDLNAQQAQQLAKSKIVGVINPIFRGATRYDAQGRLFTTNWYDSILYAPDNKIKTIYSYNQKYDVFYDSIERLSKIIVSSDTSTFDYFTNRIVCRRTYIYTPIDAPFIYPIDSSLIGTRMYDTTTFNVTYNKFGEMVYFSYFTEYHYCQNRLIAVFKQKLYGGDDYYEETNYSYDKEGMLIFKTYKSPGEFMRTEEYSYDFDHYKTYINIKLHEAKWNFKAVNYLDENKNILLTETYQDDSLIRLDTVKYLYDKSVFIYAKIHPKIYVPKIVQATKATTFCRTQDKKSYYYRCGKLLRIDDKTSNKIEKQYHFEHDTLYGYTEYVYKKTDTAHVFYLLQNDTIQYIKGEQVQIDTTEQALLKKAREITTNASKLLPEAIKYEYKLYLLGQEISTHNQTIYYRINDVYTTPN